ncbi:MAG: PadR family transcriptional regulator [Cyanothece sp. SIO1E1]|nr:PadR family transcriptional regulator [Cyanothece sp. SIO1E1]
MFKSQKLGELEELILLAIGCLSDEAYTVSIQQLLESTTGRVISMGALYTSLERLQKKGYANSTMTQPTGTRGGKSKRVYNVSFEGERALKETRAARELLWNKFNWSQAWS